MAFIFLGCTIVVLIIKSLLRDQTGRDLWRIVVAWSPLAAIAAVAYCGARWLNKRALNETMAIPGFGEERSFKIAPESFHIRDGLGEETTKWERMHSIVNTSEHLFFFLTKTHAHIVPKRAFATVEEADQFYETALGFLKAAKNQ